MALVQLSHNVTLRGARRALTIHGSSFALTLRNGRVYTYRVRPVRQPNTAAQLHARSLLQQANILARRDLLRPGRRAYWQRRAASSGYKTAIGCARAHYISRLKSRLSSAPSPKAVPVTAAPRPLTSPARLVRPSSTLPPLPLNRHSVITVRRRSSRLHFSFP